MMPESRKNERQKAQAMVEFALVLPILLLLIFGIFAFGHLFFSYSLVVASSREAARFGAAVGLTDNNLPRFRDCDEIRAAGVRVGNLAGVNETNIDIQYDGGVRADGSPVIVYPDNCPSPGVGPGYLELGDRIVVTVSVNYRPIVPLVAVQEFPLVAETRRTIIVGMPVGDVTPSAPLCSGTIVRILPLDGTSFENILVGEYVSARMEVISDDPSNPAQGTVALYYNDPDYSSPICTGNASAITNCSLAPNSWGTRIYEVPPVVPTVGALTPVPTASHLFRARYEPAPGYIATAVPCFNPSLAEPVSLMLYPAPTIIHIVAVTIVSTDDGDRARVDVNVVPDPNYPGSGIPSGPIHVSDEYGHDCTVVVPDPYSAGYCLLELTHYGNNQLTAVYNPAGHPDFNHNFLSSTVTLPYQYNTPTPTMTPTIITPAVTMTATLEARSPTETPIQVIIATATDTPEPPEVIILPTDTPVPPGLDQ